MVDNTKARTLEGHFLSVLSPPPDTHRNNVTKNQLNVNFPEKSSSVTFELLWTPNFMHDIKKTMNQTNEESASQAHAWTE